MVPYFRHNYINKFHICISEELYKFKYVQTQHYTTW